MKGEQKKALTAGSSVGLKLLLKLVICELHKSFILFWELVVQSPVVLLSDLNFSLVQHSLTNNSNLNKNREISYYKTLYENYSKEGEETKPTCLNVNKGLSMVLGDSRDDVEDRDSKASADPSVSCECPFSWRRRCNRCTSSLMVAAIISTSKDKFINKNLRAHWNEWF